jgi:DNA-binding transcriptional regulator YiaG
MQSGHTLSVFRDAAGRPKIPRMARSSGPKITAADRERGERIRRLREGLDESQAVFGERLGVEQATVSRWEAGWPVERRYWIPLSELVDQHPLDFIFGRQSEVPLLSDVAASKLADVAHVEYPQDAKMMPGGGLPSGEWFALQVVGDSMDRIAPDGAVIYVNVADKTLLHRRFYVFASGGATTFKRYMERPPRLEPYSWSGAHETIFPRREIQVVGRVGRVVLDL